ncbi:MAG: hypothetical protein H7240_07240 [Glaciimonas sp.]|nr:hypothetical protein [Glaciimonas sp.]
MIYNDKFIWLHFPKCAGVKVESLFRKYYYDVPGLIQDVVDPKNDASASWHDSVATRLNKNPEFTLGDKEIICPIRKLPSWLISRYNFECGRSPELNHNPELLVTGRFLEASGVLNHADVYIQNYLPQSLLDKGRVSFLRVENFEADFIELFGKYIDVSIIPKEEFAQRENISKNYLPEEIVHKLISSQEVYTNCPKWFSVEKLAFSSR